VRAASSEAPVPPRTQLAIGIAPFERVASPGAAVPDVAALLADRLATKGVERVVGPTGLAAHATAEPSADEVRAWAAQAAVSSLVVGRTTRLGRSLSVDVRVRSARDGAVVGTYVEEVAQPADLGGALERLSSRVLEGAEAALAEPGAAEGRAGARGGSRAAVRSDAPIQISAAQLEAFEEQGRKRLVFTGSVRASQGDLTLGADRLEAFYPPDSSQPDRLVAVGDVEVVQGDRSAHCDSATYRRAEDVVVCSGEDAVLTQGDDRVQGREIVFQLDSEVLTVKGGARVRIQPEKHAERGPTQATP
jgi:lipopolysaccharide export system protein LptA